MSHTGKFIYYEQQINREVHTTHTCGWWNERLKSKTDGSMYLTYTRLSGELEHLKIETKLIGESFECVMGESHGVWSRRSEVSRD